LITPLIYLSIFMEKSNKAYNVHSLILRNKPNQLLKHLQLDILLKNLPKRLERNT
jgi:hypothetical protein